MIEADGFLALEVLEGEVERWLAMHAVADHLFTQLPADDQAAIRRDGAPSIMHVAMLVGTRPEVRELAATILKQVHDSSRTVREAGAPMVVQPDGRFVGPLSHTPVTVERTFGWRPSDEKTRSEDGVADDRDREIEELRREVALLREALSGHLDHCPAARRSPLDEPLRL